jgi:hypothetical protein
MKSLKDATTILENTTGAFFRPNGITVYENEPHYIIKIVLAMSSSIIHT